MNQLEDFIEKLIVVQTNGSTYSGALKEIDDENGALLIQEKNASSLKTIPFTEIVNCELADSVLSDSQEPATIQTREGIDFNDKSNFFFETSEKYVPRFIQMTTEQKNAIIKENYDKYGPSKEISAYIAAIYTTNYLCSKYLKNNHNKKICIIVSRTDWFCEVAFNISRILYTHGYVPDLISLIPVNQKTIKQFLYSKEERQTKKDKVQGEFDLAIVACESAKILNQDQFKAKSIVFIGIPKDHGAVKNKSKSAAFYGPFDMEYTDFQDELVYVQSGLSRKTQIRIGVDHCPHIGYIIYPR